MKHRGDLTRAGGDGIPSSGRHAGSSPMKTVPVVKLPGFCPAACRSGHSPGPQELRPSALRIASPPQARAPLPRGGGTERGGGHGLSRDEQCRCDIFSCKGQAHTITCILKIVIIVTKGEIKN